VPIETAEDIFKMTRIIETERMTNSTKMNDSSSRSHCTVELRLYTKSGEDKVHINSLKFFDLAGSERTSKSTTRDMGNMDAATAEAVMINFTLIQLVRSMETCIALKKPLSCGDKIPPSVVWRETGFTRQLKSSFSGDAFTQFLFCISQHPSNGGETFCTLNFGQQCSGLKANVGKPKMLSLAALLKQNVTELEANQKALKQLENTDRQDPKARRFRQQLIDKNEFLIAHYGKLIEM